MEAKNVVKEILKLLDTDNRIHLGIKIVGELAEIDIIQEPKQKVMQHLISEVSKTILKSEDDWEDICQIKTTLKDGSYLTIDFSDEFFKINK